MLFHVTLDHTPEDCPIVRTGASDVPEMLARADETGVKVISALGARPQHCVYFVLDTDDINKLNDFLEPVLSWVKCEITPVSTISIS